MRYELHVYCRRDGISRDAGLHAVEEAPDLDAARARFAPEESFLLQFYDEVDFHIDLVENGVREAVARWSRRRDAGRPGRDTCYNIFGRG